MPENIKTTIRLKKQEAIELKSLAFELTKEAIMMGKQKIYTESDIAHFAIENLIDLIVLDDNGDLSMIDLNTYKGIKQLGLPYKRRKKQS